jgi:hypothetical protein
MANISFGLDADKYAKERGFDKYQTTIGEVLSETAKDAWKYNPVSSIVRLSELETNRSENTGELLIDRQELNDKYGKFNLFFDEDEKQSTVDIIVERKKAEINRQSIIQRGPEGRLSNLYLPTLSKFGTAMVTSIADPINLAMMFVPYVGQARFASLVARYGFTKARFAKGAIEGTIGIGAVEPLVYTAAQREQSDYGLVDSFMAVGFGTILGGGLHVGIGKLKDFNTARKFKKKIKEARAKANIKDGDEPVVNLYKEYYPENSRIMKELAETNPDVRRTLLTKALSDLMEDIPVNVKNIADLDPKLRNAQLNEKVAPNERVNVKNQVDEEVTLKKQEVTSQDTGARTRNPVEQKAVDEYEASRSQEDITLRNLDEETGTVQSQLNVLKERQKDLNIKDSEEIKTTTKESDELNTKQKEIKDAIIDGINCFNGR